jgi:L-lysine exporter family protein LysE/ArgO
MLLAGGTHVAILDGFILGMGLIVALGSQNVFILRQGLRRAHVFLVCAISTACDSALIALGAGGVGALLAANETLRLGAKWGGGLFLFGFAAWSLKRAIRPHGDPLVGGENERSSASAAAAVAFALALLNPHVYIDTVLVLGGVGAQYGLGDRWWFVAGASAASAVWFFGTGYGARLLIPLFSRPGAARLLDAGVAAIMAWIGLSLLTGRLG